MGAYLIYLVYLVDMHGGMYCSMASTNRVTCACVLGWILFRDRRLPRLLSGGITFPPERLREIVCGIVCRRYVVGSDSVAAEKESSTSPPRHYTKAKEP